MRISRTCWISPGYSLKFKDQQPHGQWRCCIAYRQGQHGGVDASEWTRKCELAGIFYSCEYVHRAVLATFCGLLLHLILKHLTIGLLVISLSFTAHSASPSPTIAHLPSLPSPPSSLGSFPPFPTLKGNVPHLGGGEEENELHHRCPILRLLGKKKSF